MFGNSDPVTQCSSSDVQDEGDAVSMCRSNNIACRRGMVNSLICCLLHCMYHKADPQMQQHATCVNSMLETNGRLQQCRVFAFGSRISVMLLPDRSDTPSK